MAGKAVNAISTISSAIRNPENAWKIMWGKAYVENIGDALLHHTWEGITCHAFIIHKPWDSDDQRETADSGRERAD
jgi:hypothetical protein